MLFGTTSVAATTPIAALGDSTKFINSIHLMRMMIFRRVSRHQAGCALDRTLATNREHAKPQVCPMGPLDRHDQLLLACRSDRLAVRLSGRLLGRFRSFKSVHVRNHDLPLLTPRPPQIGQPAELEPTPQSRSGATN